MFENPSKMGLLDPKSSGEISNSRTAVTLTPKPTDSELDDARTARIATVTHDVLTTQPAWIIEQVQALHNNDDLEGVSVAELARRITLAAVLHDRHGAWPTDLTRQVAVSVKQLEPVPEIG